jgi:HNH endonuclease
MREVAPGDLVFSFADTLIKSIGIATSSCYDCPKPFEFGSAGKVWGQTGWRVDVKWMELKNQIKPSSHMDALGSYLPAKYSPLTPAGSGLQSVYLTHVPPGLADALIALIGSEATHARRMADSWVSDIVPTETPAFAQSEWEDDLAEQIQTDPAVPDTQKPQIILARRGQGTFRERVSRIEHTCRITGVNRPEHLIASHCKPWRDWESNDERLDGENGLLLTPTVDHLFDRGFISFENDGELLISPIVHRESLRRMGIPSDERRNVGGFTEGQRRYLEFHREAVFLAARVKT